MYMKGWYERGVGGGGWDDESGKRVGVGTRY